MSERAELEKRAKEIAGPHLECEDPWYSCPLSPEGCADDRQHGCTCGADTRAKEIVALCAAAQAENERLTGVQKAAEIALEELLAAYASYYGGEAAKKELAEKARAALRSVEKGKEG